MGHTDMYLLSDEPEVVADAEHAGGGGYAAV